MGCDLNKCDRDGICVEMVTGIPVSGQEYCPHYVKTENFVDGELFTRDAEGFIVALPLTERSDIIKVIDDEGKRDDFEGTVYGFGRTPEIYFDEYLYKEPGIWVNVLNDLQIDVEKFVVKKFRR